MGDHPKSFLGTFLDLGGETYNHSTAIISSTHSPDTDTIRITKKLFDLDYHLYYSQYGFRERPSRTFKRSKTASKPARCVGPAYHGAQSLIDGMLAISDSYESDSRGPVLRLYNQLRTLLVISIPKFSMTTGEEKSDWWKKANNP